MNIFKLICDNQVLSSHFPFHYGARADSGQSLLLNARMRLMGRCEVVPGDGTSSLLALLSLFRSLNSDRLLDIDGRWELRDDALSGSAVN